MKKIAKVIVISVLMLAPVAFVPAVSATTYTCPVGYAWSSSESICVSKTEYTCKVNISTNIATVFNNDQQVISGILLVSNNTSSGNSMFGSATNSSKVTFNVDVTNLETEEQVCTVEATVLANVVPEVKPVTPEQDVRPTVLPNTSSDIFSKILTVTSFLLGLGVAGLFLGVTAYRLFRTK